MSKKISTKDTAYQESISSYRDALNRVRVARNNLKYADPDLFDIVYEEVKNAEEALNLAIRRVKMNQPVLN